MNEATKNMTPDLRWDPYFIRDGKEFTEFWQRYLSDGQHKLLYIIGVGFDPRMCEGLENILTIKNGSNSIDCMVIEFDEGPDSPSEKLRQLVSTNQTRLESLLGQTSNHSKKRINMWSQDGPGKRRVGSLEASKLISIYENIASYTDILVDVSSLPRSIYFSLIAKILYLLTPTATNPLPLPLPNLHVVVAENVEIDKEIKEVGIDDTANYVYGFGGIDLESTAQMPTMWVPILGEGKVSQLEHIYTLVNPDEICPVLPFPSSNPRRGDELLIEYRELLFDHWRIEPKNIIYVSEQNPFQAYRQIHRTIIHYTQALAPLGGCKAVISALSSKLLSIGALLAAIELKMSETYIGLANVEAQGYSLGNIENIDTTMSKKLYTLWLVGSCYEL